jgi:hypothetical protein
MNKPRINNRKLSILLKVQTERHIILEGVSQGTESFLGRSGQWVSSKDISR